MPEVIINGPAGRIEARYHQAEDPAAPCALVLHPHPEHGGTMNNKVVYHIYKAFADNGFSVLRFNFRGVGRSSGQYDGGVGEMLDAACALDWLQNNNHFSNSFWISGFSFGGWIALQLLMRRPEINGFVAVSPPVNRYDFSFLSPCPTSGLIIQGDMDSVVNEESVSKLAHRLNAQKGIEVIYNVIHGADHFFRNNLDELYMILNQYIHQQLKDKSSSKKDKRKKRLTDEELI